MAIMKKRSCITCGNPISQSSSGLCMACYIKKRTKYPRDFNYYQEAYVKQGLTVEELARRLGNPNIAKSGKLSKIIKGLGISIRKRTDDQWGNKNHQWKGGRVIDGAGYVLLKMPSHHRANKRGYVREHIVVWEEANKRSVPLGWHIHHKGTKYPINSIENKSDNRIENLEALPAGQHSSFSFVNWNNKIREYKEEIKSLKEQIKCLTA